MQAFVDAGRAAVQTKNWYAAATVALSLPDICAGIDEPDAKNGPRYMRWCSTWFIPKYTRPLGPKMEPFVFISAADVWGLRCAMVHDGTHSIDMKKDKRRELAGVLLFDDSVRSHCNRFGNVLQLNTAQFCEDLFRSVEEWCAEKVGIGNSSLLTAGLLRIFKAGDDLGGIRFGS